MELQQPHFRPVAFEQVAHESDILDTVLLFDDGKMVVGCRLLIVWRRGDLLKD
jgi:hypothetical protein